MRKEICLYTALMLALCSSWAWGVEPGTPCPNVFADILALALSKVGVASYKQREFDVRVVASHGKAKFSATALNDKAVSQTHHVLGQYEALGFSARSHIHVIVEAHPGAVKRVNPEIIAEARAAVTWQDGLKNLLRGPGGWRAGLVPEEWKQFAEDALSSGYGHGRMMDERLVETPGAKKRNTWVSEQGVRTPWIGGADQFIGLPGIVGRNIFMGKLKPNAIGNYPKVLFLPAITDVHHSLDYKSMLAHELAHATENENSHQSILWREARADIMAYFITADTEARLPPGTKLEVMDSEGNFTVKEVEIIRSLKNPTVKKVTDVVPHSSAQHTNSQIISSFLYELSQKEGQAEVVDFIKWMDDDRTNLIPNIKSSNDIGHGTFKKEIAYVDDGYPPGVRRQYKETLNMIGAKIRKWAETRNFDAQTSQWIEAQLNERGI